MTTIKLHYVEGGDGTRHLHAANCGHLIAQLRASEVWEVDIDSNAEEDELLLEIWEEFLDDDSEDEEFDHYAGMTFYRACAEDVLPFGEEGDSSGNSKADAFMDECEAAAWDVEFITDDEYVSVKARREYVDPTGGLRHEEVLDLSWSPTRLVEAHYLSGLPGEVAKKLSSVKGAIDRLTQPTPRTRKTRDLVVREVPIRRTLKIKIPFDIEEAYDDEIISAVKGKKLIWWNDTGEYYDEAYVIGRNHIYIETGTAGRAILTFCSPEGFRSVALENLVQVK